MTKKQIKEVTAIKIEMDQLQRELIYLENIAKPQSLDGQLRNVRYYLSTAYEKRTEYKNYKQSLQEAIKSISLAHAEQLQAILDNYTPLNIALRLDAIEKGDKTND